MTGRRGLSVRWQLTLSHAGLVVVAGGLLLAVVWVFLLRYVPDRELASRGGFIPNRSDLLRAFAPRAAAAIVVLVGIGLIGGWWLAGRMLRPLDRIADAARLAAAGSLSHRIGLRGRHDEFAELAGVFDTMLQRLESQLAEHRRFAANASHELRTPLATTQTILEVARDDPDRDVDGVFARLITVNRRAVRITEALLTLNRAESDDVRTDPVDLGLLVDEAIDTVVPLAERRGIELAVAAPPAWAEGTEALLLAVVTNLIHNAVVHNQRGGSVRIGLRSAGDRIELVVSNTGAVLDPGVLGTLREPFQRAAARIRSDDDHGGTGLGLAIADAVAVAHGGRLDLAARAGGGLVATLTLPAAAPPTGDR